MLFAILTISNTALEDGTLIFLENTSQIVSLVTGSPITHVAIAMNDGDKTFVYEADIPKVCRVSYNDFCHILKERNRLGAGIRMRILKPKIPISKSQAQDMKSYLDGEIGRTYSLLGYCKKRSVQGINCVELVGTSLNVSKNFNIENCSKLHPGSLYDLVSSGFHSEEMDISPENLGDWRERANYRWRITKRGTRLILGEMKAECKTQLETYQPKVSQVLEKIERFKVFLPSIKIGKSFPPSGE